MMHGRLRLYPPNWKQLALACKELAGWRCQHCRVRQGSKRKSRRTGKWYRVWLHAAHIHLHDTHNPHPELLALCPRCHGSYDYWLKLREAVVLFEICKHRILLARRGLCTYKEALS